MKKHLSLLLALSLVLAGCGGESSESGGSDAGPSPESSISVSSETDDSSEQSVSKTDETASEPAGDDASSPVTKGSMQVIDEIDIDSETVSAADNGSWDVSQSDRPSGGRNEAVSSAGNTGGKSTQSSTASSSKKTTADAGSASEADSGSRDSSGHSPAVTKKVTTRSGTESRDESRTADDSSRTERVTGTTRQEPVPENELPDDGIDWGPLIPVK